MHAIADRAAAATSTGSLSDPDIAASTRATAYIGYRVTPPLTSATPRSPVNAPNVKVSIRGWGGTTQSSQQKNWAQPFTQASGISVLMDGPTDYGKLKAMVDSGNVSWDVVDVEGDFAYAAQKAGLIEPIDYSVVKEDELDPRFATQDAVGSFYYSFVLGYNKSTFTGARPQNWATMRPAG
jgi:putative spermidine/putrescine transport system substrate-binding protein